VKQSKSCRTTQRKSLSSLPRERLKLVKLRWSSPEPPGSAAETLLTAHSCAKDRHEKKQQQCLLAEPPSRLL